VVELGGYALLNLFHFSFFAKVTELITLAQLMKNKGNAAMRPLHELYDEVHPDSDLNPENITVC
jgi:hypothetical protein